MRALILAAGMGTRLRPHTNDKPKALVPLNNKPLLDYQLSVLRHAGIRDISLLTGYLAACFAPYRLSTIHNPDYANTNMVWSLFKARQLFDSKTDLLVCYGDIAYNDAVLSAVLQQTGPVVIAADRQWQSLWQLRMEDVLADAETFKMAPGSHKVVNLGQKITDLNQVQAQYIGLIKFRAASHQQVLSLYDQLPESQQRKMYMTDFIQHLINCDIEVNAALHNGGWLEVDTTTDLTIYSSHARQILRQP
ncbi:NTP transferase domain-containing protein [Rheinheimera nanhaiensis]|uniref:MobA-like NTP transferase domain-containing protein n=1 Tax=Rheinheimera nanhaiensis E407-8 TaxID=562729 RepID=I1DWK4_9GAMM|nr:phosphocholine cytidylyltransferase family protein [Rheinheimera nanhaiensis]GAB58432.1 hypothetical protein RNAN_1404 [Rheinheimera nanhaiensis E407-8]